MKAIITRFYKYRDSLARFHDLGCSKVFSDHLASAVRSSSAQVRKDFSLFGITGHKRGGFVVRDLIAQLDAILGTGHVRRVILVGCNHIGEALLQYDGFKKGGIVIGAAFDADLSKVRREAEIPVLPLEEMDSYVRQHKVTTGVVAVRDGTAQDVLDRMVRAGIRGVLNFSAEELEVPPSCYINNINLRLELELVNYFVQAVPES